MVSNLNPLPSLITLLPKKQKQVFWNMVVKQQSRAAAVLQTASGSER